MTTRTGLIIMGAAFALELLVAPFIKDPPDPSLVRRIKPWSGHAYWSHITLIPGTNLDAWGFSDKSTIVLYEDDKPLGPWRSDVADVTSKGLGRYTVSGPAGSAYVVFSASDNSNPLTNGRTYRAHDPEASGRVEDAIRGVELSK
jgi:hypothetical protein